MGMGLICIYAMRLRRSKELIYIMLCAYGAVDRLYRLFEALILFGLLEASRRRDMRRHFQEKALFCL